MTSKRAAGTWALVSTPTGWFCGVIERGGNIIDARDGRRYQAYGLRDVAPGGCRAPYGCICNGR